MNAMAKVQKYVELVLNFPVSFRFLFSVACLAIALSSSNAAEMSHFCYRRGWESHLSNRTGPCCSYRER